MTPEHDMAERLVFAVQIAHEMFCALGQAQDRLDVDHLRRRRLHGRVFFADQAQIFPVSAAHILLHADPPFVFFFSLYYVSRIKKRVSAKKSCGNPLLLSPCLRRERVAQREEHIERAPFPDLTVHAVLEPVSDENGLDDGKPQPRTFYGALMRIGGAVIAVPLRARCPCPYPKRRNGSCSPPRAGRP